jgi:hypothetical protein
MAARAIPAEGQDVVVAPVGPDAPAAVDRAGARSRMGGMTPKATKFARTVMRVLAGTMLLAVPAATPLVHGAVPTHATIVAAAPLR